jgi:hypothetical protein
MLQPDDRTRSESQAFFDQDQAAPVLPHRVSDAWEPANSLPPPPVGAVGNQLMAHVPAKSSPEEADNVGIQHPKKRKRETPPDRAGIDT